MKKSSWKKHHKWFGLLFCFFILMFCISGILLNHRSLISSVDVSRKYLPKSFQFNKWNNGLLKGSILLNSSDSTVLIYGNAGLWKSKTDGSSFTAFNQGLPKGIDHHNIQGVAQMPNGSLFAAGQFELYQLNEQGSWEVVLTNPQERFRDLSMRGDSLLLLSRSELFVATPPYRNFQSVQFKAPQGYDNKVSLFRTVWLIHSGELFGTIGKLVVDLLGLSLILISITGILYWLLPKHIKRMKARNKPAKQSIKLLKGSLNWHNKLGTYTLILTLFLTFTGWCLRPPALLALVYSKVPAVPGSKLDTPNPWADKLRAIRYDVDQGDWLLSSSEGFFSLPELEAQPQAISTTPPVSVMGINAFEKDKEGNWIIGSFSGLYIWNRATAQVLDYYTQESPVSMSAAPFGKRAISGFTQDFKGQAIPIEYEEGTQQLEMPTALSHLPISLWNLALEVHTGRIYTFLGPAALIYTFFGGILMAWVLWTGYRVRKRRREK